MSSAAAAVVGFVGADELSVSLAASFLRSGALVRCFVAPEVSLDTTTHPASTLPTLLPPPFPPLLRFVSEVFAGVTFRFCAGGWIGDGGRGAGRRLLREPSGSGAR